MCKNDNSKVVKIENKYLKINLDLLDVKKLLDDAKSSLHNLKMKKSLAIKNHDTGEWEMVYKGLNPKVFNQIKSEILKEEKKSIRLLEDKFYDFLIHFQHQRSRLTPPKSFHVNPNKK